MHAENRSYVQEVYDRMSTKKCRSQHTQQELALLHAARPPAATMLRHHGVLLDHCDLAQNQLKGAQTTAQRCRAACDALAAQRSAPPATAWADPAAAIAHQRELSAQYLAGYRCWSPPPFAAKGQLGATPQRPPGSARVTSPRSRRCGATPSAPGSARRSPPPTEEELARSARARKIAAARLQLAKTPPEKRQLLYGDGTPKWSPYYRDPRFAAHDAALYSISFHTAATAIGEFVDDARAVQLQEKLERVAAM